MPEISVVAAIIIDKNNKILSAQRGFGELENKWEFPGGKIDEYEDKKVALKRRIKEELNLDIIVEDWAFTVTDDSLSSYLYLYCYFCKLNCDVQDMMLFQHKEVKWLDKEELDTLDWAPVDVKAIKELKNRI